MKKVVYNKLIRDKIPEVITRTGGQFKTKTLTKKQFEKELKDKLIEESKELGKASEKEIINELADVLELVKAISEHHKLNFKKVEKYQEKKQRERGGFKKKLFLLWSSEK